MRRAWPIIFDKTILGHMNFFLLGLLGIWGVIFPTHAGPGALFGFGAKTPPRFVSVCQRTPQVRDAIVAEVGLPCEQIKRKHLKKISSLDLFQQGIESLRADDFFGILQFK